MIDRKCYLYSEVSLIRHGWNAIVGSFNKDCVQILFLVIQSSMRGCVYFSTADDKYRARIIDDSIAERIEHSKCYKELLVKPDLSDRC